MAIEDISGARHQMLGILDSGIGGLWIARKIIERWPKCDIVYFGDTGRTPYGNKSATTVVARALQNTQLLLEQGAAAVLIVSHTLSAVAGSRLEEAFPVPILDVIRPTAQQALQTPLPAAIGVVGSRATIDSKRYPKMIRSLDPAVTVFAAACPLLVPLVEEDWLKKPETVRIIKKYLHPLKVRQIDTLILGCNHYALLKKIIQRKIGKKVRVVDAGEGVMNALIDFFNARDGSKGPVCNGGRRRFLVSDLTPQRLAFAKRIYGRNIQLEVKPC